MNKLYYVHLKGEDWGVMIIAENHKTAKYQGWKFINSEYGESYPYIDIRAERRNIAIPENERVKQFDSCGVDFWLCDAWGWCDNDDCENFANRKGNKGDYE